MPSHTQMPTFFYGALARPARTTPSPFRPGGSGLVCFSPALTEAQAAEEILYGTMAPLCGDGPGRTVYMRDLQSQAFPGPSNSSVVRDTLPEEENGTRFSPGLISSRPTGSQVASQLVIKPFSPWEYRTQLSPHRFYIPVVKYLANAHTVFLVDDSMHMAPFWSQIRDCVTACISTIIDEAEASFVSSGDYFPYGDEQEEFDLADEGDSEESDLSDEGDSEEFGRAAVGNSEEFPTMSLEFLNSPISLRSLTYAKEAWQTFNLFTPHIDRTQIGTRISEVLADLFEPHPGHPIHIIIPTVGYVTDKPEDTIVPFLRELDALRLSDDKVAITLFQVGSDPGAAARLEDYETGYNTWGIQRDLVYSECCGTGFPGTRRRSTSPRRMLRAVSRGLELRRLF